MVINVLTDHSVISGMICYNLAESKFHKLNIRTNGYEYT